MTQHDLIQQYIHLLDKPPRRTNECWLANNSSCDSVYVCGHKFILQLENTSLSVWQLMDGQHSMGEIANELEHRYEIANKDTLMENLISCVLLLEILGLAAWRSRPLFEEVPLDE